MCAGGFFMSRHRVVVRALIVSALMHLVLLSGFDAERGGRSAPEAGRLNARLLTAMPAAPMPAPSSTAATPVTTALPPAVAQLKGGAARPGRRSTVPTGPISPDAGALQPSLDEFAAVKLRLLLAEQLQGSVLGTQLDTALAVEVRWLPEAPPQLMGEGLSATGHAALQEALVVALKISREGAVAGRLSLSFMPIPNLGAEGVQ